MTNYLITAWCDRPFYAQCEIDADTPQEALAKAKVAMNDATAEECDHNYDWHEWRVDTEDAEGVLFHIDQPAWAHGDDNKLLAALAALLPYAENEAYALEKLKDSPEAEAEAGRALEAVENARRLIETASELKEAP